MWKNRGEFELLGYLPHIIAIALEVNVLACEGRAFPKVGLVRKVVFRPIIDGLPADQDIRESLRIPGLKYFRELLEGKARNHKSSPFCHGPGHLAQVGNTPFRSVAHQRDFTLPRCRRT
jgi:hypothetical protein